MDRTQIIADAAHSRKEHNTVSSPQVSGAPHATPRNRTDLRERDTIMPASKATATENNTVSESTSEPHASDAIKAPEVALRVSDADLKELIDTPGSKRRMPDHLRRYLLSLQGGKLYLPAPYRIVWFRDELGDEWGIETKMIEGGYNDKFAVFHAKITRPDGTIASEGTKSEFFGNGKGNNTGFPAFLEKAETGAISRALAMLGFGTQFMPELDEVIDFATGEIRGMADSPVRSAGRSTANRPQTAKPSEVKNTAQKYPRGTKWDGPEGSQCPVCRAPVGLAHGTSCLA
jgi:hypothetical protein